MGFLDRAVGALAQVAAKLRAKEDEPGADGHSAEGDAKAPAVEKDAWKPAAMADEDLQATERPAPPREYAYPEEEAPTDPGHDEHKFVVEEKGSAFALELDGAAFSQDHAKRALSFVNTATEADLQAAGVKGKALRLVIENRPFQNLTSIAHTAGIGKKTIEALADATK